MQTLVANEDWASGKAAGDHSSLEVLMDLTLPTQHLMKVTWKTHCVDQGWGRSLGQHLAKITNNPVDISCQLIRAWPCISSLTQSSGLDIYSYYVGRTNPFLIIHNSLHMFVIYPMSTVMMPSYGAR